jgi:hypothetical protein
MTLTAEELAAIDADFRPPAPAETSGSPRNP